VMAAGLGTRMRSSVPKHLHEILGRRMVDWVLAAADGVGADPLVVVAAPSTVDSFAGVETVLQEEPLGTGHAVSCARAALEDRADDVLVLSGDTPLLTTELLRQLVETHRRTRAAATVLSFEPSDPKHYGRVLRDPDGGLHAIVEYGDATPEERAVSEVNSSIYVFDAGRLWPVLDRLEPYLRLVFPDGRLSLGEGFALETLQRGKATEKVAVLSEGTREQLAVLVRLGFGRLLAEAGSPAPLILDDALVYSDDTRIERMFEALKLAAESHQVLVLTCRERTFAGLGGNRVRVAAWRPS